jgi:hypothetical protein
LSWCRSCGTRANHNGRRCRERLIPGGKSVGLEDIGGNVDVGFSGQRARTIGRHRRLNQAEEIAGGSRTPAAHERRASKRRNPVEICAVAGCAVGLIRSPAGGRLLGSERPWLLSGCKRDRKLREESQYKDTPIRSCHVTTSTTF